MTQQSWYEMKKPGHDIKSIFIKAIINKNMQTAQTPQQDYKVLTAAIKTAAERIKLEPKSPIWEKYPHTYSAKRMDRKNAQLFA